jgi:Arm DNA-binding domain
MPKLAPPLTEEQVQALAPKANRYKVGDGEGLCILIEPNGVKRWQLDYKLAGKESCVRFGTYPQMSLSEARLMRAEALQLIAEGINPASHRKEQRKQEEAAKPITPKLQFAMSDQGGLIIENYASRIILSQSQTDALKAFLLSTPPEQ